jgi:hypothetical protein
MKNLTTFGAHARRVCEATVVAIAALIILAQVTPAAPWNNIEPLKSRRPDVERALGQPLKDQPGANGVLHFKVAGGTVTIAFIDARFVATKKLSPELEGTVRQIVLQHDNSSDTPESMNISSNPDFKRDEDKNVTKYTNNKEGIVYVFVGGRLKTTYFTPGAKEWARAQK